MNKYVITLLTTSSIILSTAVFAHEEPIEEQWCQNGNIIIIGEFKFTPLHLTRFDRYSKDVCPNFDGGIDIESKSCGQFDDEFGITRAATAHLCHSIAYDLRDVSLDSSIGTVRPIFYGPESIKNSDKNHHKVYSIVQGVHFAWGLCKMEVDSRILKESLSVEMLLECSKF